MKKSLTLLMVVALTFTLGTVTLADSKIIEFDFSNPEHVALVEQPLEIWPVYIENDPFGEPALFFPTGSEAMRPPSNVYPHMRFAVFNVPEVDDFEFTVNTMGVGGEHSNPAQNGGNRSLSIIFGYQDPSNYWVVYYAYTDSTRVAQMVDGQEVRVCWPRQADVFWPNNERYQEAVIRLTTEGDNKVLRAYLDGKPTPLDLCTFPAFMYEPGKVGVGGHSTSTVQSWFINGVKLEILN